MCDEEPHKIARMSNENTELPPYRIDDAYDDDEEEEEVSGLPSGQPEEPSQRTSVEEPPKDRPTTNVNPFGIVRPPPVGPPPYYYGHQNFHPRWGVMPPPFSQLELLSVSTYGTTYESCGTEPNSFSLSPYSSHNLHSISV
jgi:hypothetical protein